MATDSTISNLTQNPSLDGTEEVATEKGGENFKNTYNALKIFFGISGTNTGDQDLSGLQPNQTVTDFTDAFTIADGTNNATLTMTNAVDKDVTVTTTSFSSVGDGCELSSLLGVGFPIVVPFDVNVELVDPNGIAVDSFNLKGLRRMNDVGGKVQIQLY